MIALPWRGAAEAQAGSDPGALGKGEMPLWPPALVLGRWRPHVWALVCYLYAVRNVPSSHPCHPPSEGVIELLESVSSWRAALVVVFPDAFFLCA